MMNFKYIIPLLLLPLMFSGCNESDDLTEIFTGKTWKLTGIFYDKGGKEPEWCMDYWASNAEWEASDELFNKSGNFILKFSGSEDGDQITGNYEGRAANNDIKGTWGANGKSNSFSTSISNNPSKEDVLGRAFINGLINATKYNGDTNNLRIYFEEPTKKDKRYLMFHVAN